MGSPASCALTSDTSYQRSRKLTSCRTNDIPKVPHLSLTLFFLQKVSERLYRICLPFFQIRVRFHHKHYFRSTMTFLSFIMNLLCPCQRGISNHRYCHVCTMLVRPTLFWSEESSDKRQACPSHCEENSVEFF